MAKILLVEDDNNLREIFEMRLQAEGYQTVTAGNGEEGITVAMREKPDLIIADVMMPKLSGFDMLENLRAVPEMKDTKVVMMTALGEADDQARGQALGVVKYLVKSQATLEDFARVVREVLPPDGATAAPHANGNSEAITNVKESENKMPDDPNATNPMTPPAEPAGTPPAEPTTPPAGPMMDAPADDQADSAQTTAEEQGAVNDQVNNFVTSTPADTPAASLGGTPAGDSSASFSPSPAPSDSPVPAADLAGAGSAPDVPPTTPPATPPATEDPSATTDPSTGAL